MFNLKLTLPDVILSLLDNLPGLMKIIFRSVISSKIFEKMCSKSVCNKALIVLTRIFF